MGINGHSLNLLYFNLGLSKVNLILKLNSLKKKGSGLMIMIMIWAAYKIRVTAVTHSENI